MKLSIIIPTYNEEKNVGKLVRYLKDHSNSEIEEVIVSDGGSQDETLAEARKAGAVAVVSPGKGRAAQMNYGVSVSKGDHLYFVHADSLPPKTYVKDIATALRDGYSLGRYRTKFNSDKTILKVNAWFTRFDFFICMGGDQTLFVSKLVFDSIGGFKEEMKIMEEYEFCQRARTVGKYKIFKKAAVVSARKYDTNSWFRVQKANARVVKMYKRGASQEELVRVYNQMLHYRSSAI